MRICGGREWAGGQTMSLANMRVSIKENCVNSNSISRRELNLSVSANVRVSPARIRIN